MTNAPVRNEHEPVAVVASIAARLIRRYAAAGGGGYSLTPPSREGGDSE